jgi:hypothetical protein
MAFSGAPALGNLPKRNSYRRRCQREVDKKYPAPGSMLDQPAAENGPYRSCDRREAGPRADGLTAASLVKGCTDNRQAPGHEQRGPHALNAPGNDQLIDIRGKSATQGRHRENRHPQREHQAAAKQVTE